MPIRKIKIKSDNALYPVGSIYISEKTTSPASIFGGTWEQLPEGYALWTATNGAGSTINAGLPNIFGWINVLGYGGFDAFSDAGGCFWKDMEGHQSYQADTYMKDIEGKTSSLNFSAALYNSIYGNSPTVQPPAYKIYAWKRVA